MVEPAKNERNASQSTPAVADSAVVAKATLAKSAAMARQAEDTEVNNKILYFFYVGSDFGKLDRVVISVVRKRLEDLI